MNRNKFWIGLILFILVASALQAQDKPSPPQPNILDPDYLNRPQDSEKEMIPDWQARWELARILSYVKKYPESITEYERLLSERPELSEARLEMAHVLNWMGSPEKAIRIYEEIPSDKLDDRSRIEMADIYLAKKQYNQAMTLYQNYLETHPQDYQVRAKLADALSWSGKYAEAIAVYKKILIQVPNDKQIRRKYAFVLIWSNQHEAAIAELRKTLDP
jgi:tetratricopeptide (TPR) repeat protein